MLKRRLVESFLIMAILVGVASSAYLLSQTHPTTAQPNYLKDAQ